MNLPGEVIEWLDAQGHGEVQSSAPVGGGCINNGARLETSSGPSFFLKQNSSTPETMFAREADGLTALSLPDCPRVPVPYLAGTDFLLLEDLMPGPQSGDYWAEFGRQLANLHDHHGESFGFDDDNFIGSTPQPNRWTEDGFEFFAEHRLGFQAELAFQQGLINRKDFREIGALAGRLGDLVPSQPPSLIHGDLWSGNAITAAEGEPAIIDPAVHYGWAEAELGMTNLFGGFPDAFYRSYEESRFLEAGWRDRLPIYNLYHLLNHVNLFGAGYLGQVRSVLQRFS